MLGRLSIPVALLVGGMFTSVAAQQMKVYRYSDRAHSRVEVVPFGGYVWTLGHDYYYGYAEGTLDLEDAACYGVNIDFTVHPGSQVRLTYRREDTHVIFQDVLARDQLPASVEYWQIGGLVAGAEGPSAVPYGMLTLGSTRFLIGGDDVWKFSMIFGLGVKAYSSGKFGVQIQGSFPFTFIDGGGSISCGPAGCFSSGGGYGLGQIDVTGGIVIGL